MILLLVFVLLFKVVCFLFSTSFGKQTGSDVINSAIETSDGGFLVVGQTKGWCEPVCDRSELLIAKLNRRAEVEYSKSLVFSDYQDVAVKTIQTMDGNYAILSYFNEGDSTRILFLKMNTSGDIFFMKDYHKTSDMVRGFDFFEEPDGSFVIGGEVYPNTPFKRSELLLLKIDEDGNIIFQSTYGSEFNDEYVGIHSPLANISDGYLLVGQSWWFPGANISGLVTKFERNGSEVVWSYTLSDGDDYYEVSLQSAISTIDDCVVIVGYINQPMYEKIILTKMGSTGNIIWAKKVSIVDSELPTEHIVGFDVAEDSENGDLYIIGYYRGHTAGEKTYYFLKISGDADEVYYSRIEGHPLRGPGNLAVIAYPNDITPVSYRQFLVSGFIETTQIGIDDTKYQAYLHRIHCWNDLPISDFEVELEVELVDWDVIQTKLEEDVYYISDPDMVNTWPVSYTDSVLSGDPIFPGDQEFFFEYTTCGEYLQTEHVDLVCSGGLGICIANEYCKCNDLYYLGGDNVTCIGCPVGYTQDPSNLYNCTLCPSGYTSDYQSTNTCIPCEPGYYEEGRICFMCPAGTYQERYGMDECSYCPAGFFGRDKGAPSIVNCKPCPAGYKQPYEMKTNLSDCIQCDNSISCPRGSSKEFITLDGLFSETTKHDSLAYIPTEVEYETKLYMMAGVFFVGFIFLCVFCYLTVIDLLSLHTFQKCWCCVQFRNLDVFYSLSHEVRENQSPVKKKTCHGGFCSVISLVLTLTLVSWSIADFTTGNKKIQKSTDFYFFGTDEEIEGEMVFSINIYGEFEECNSTASLSGFTSIGEESDSNYYFRTEFIYVGEEPVGCVLELSCPHCRVSDPDSLQLDFQINYERRFIRMVEYTAKFPHYNAVQNGDESADNNNQYYSIGGKMYAYDGTLSDSSITVSLFLTEFISLSSWNLLTQTINQEINVTKTGIGANVLSVTKNRVDDLSGMEDDEFFTFSYILRLSNFKYCIEEYFPQSLLNFFAQLFALFGACVTLVGVSFSMYEGFCIQCCESCRINKKTKKNEDRDDDVESEKDDEKKEEGEKSSSSSSSPSSENENESESDTEYDEKYARSDFEVIEKQEEEGNEKIEESRIVVMGVQKEEQENWNKEEEEEEEEEKEKGNNCSSFHTTDERIRKLEESIGELISDKIISLENKVVELQKKYEDCQFQIDELKGKNVI